MIPERVTKLLARLDGHGPEQKLALRALDGALRASRLHFLDTATVLETVAEVEKRTGKRLSEVADLVRKHWPARPDGWAGLPTEKKFEFLRTVYDKVELSTDECRRLVEINDRFCVAPGNQIPAGDIEFLDRLLRSAERTPVRKYA